MVHIVLGNLFAELLTKGSLNPPRDNSFVPKISGCPKIQHLYKKYKRNWNTVQ